MQHVLLYRRRAGYFWIFASSCLGDLAVKIRAKIQKKQEISVYTVISYDTHALERSRVYYSNVWAVDFPTL